jgi:hypothetical protein
MLKDLVRDLLQRVDSGAFTIDDAVNGLVAPVSGHASMLTQPKLDRIAGQFRLAIEMGLRHAIDADTVAETISAGIQAALAREQIQSP